MQYARNLTDERAPRVAIIGSRGFLHYWKVPLYMYKHVGENETIVSGGANGVDSAARYGARILGLDYMEFKPKYSIYGIKAPLHRNIEIVNTCDRLVAFWDCDSRGTQHALATCKAMGKPYAIVMDE